MVEKKYYWLRLQRDFFKRHDIRIIEEMENGKDYLLFYLKLLVESIDHEGNLRFSDTVPYNDKMLSVVTNTNVDIVRSALKVFEQLDMIEVLEDETIYMTEVEKMIGAFSQDEHTRESTRLRVQAFRERKKQDCIMDKRYSNVTCNGEIEIDIEKEKEIDIDNTTPAEWDDDKHSNIENFEHLIETELHKEVNADLIQCLKDWLIYKDHRKPKRDNHYQIGTIRKLANRLFKEAKTYGADAVIGMVDNSIMNNYQGIIWDSLSRSGNKKITSPDVMGL